MQEDKILSFNAIELQKYEPNRYPFLYIDRVTECVPGKYAKGYKNLSNNEWFFPIHYEGHPFMPAAIQTEALSQMVTIIFTTLSGIDSVDVKGAKWSAKFHKEIYPGDRLDIEAVADKFTRGVGIGHAKGYVDGELACEVEITMVIPCIFDKYRPRKKSEGKN
jgi:3-hydroxyacyl-[acyl-carrier-protein] dehydratase